MADKKSNVANSNLYIGIALTAVGVLFCAFRAQLVSVLLTAVGACLLLLGTAEIFKKRLANGLIEIISGVIIIICGWTAVDIALIVLGLIFVGYAIYSVICNLPTLKRSSIGDILASLAYPALTVTAGAILIAAKWTLSDGLFIAIGVISIVAGIAQMISSVSQSQKNRRREAA